MFFEWFHRQVVWCLVIRVFLLSVSPFGFLSLLFLGYLQGGSNGVLSCVKLHEAGVRLQVQGTEARRVPHRRTISLLQSLHTNNQKQTYTPPEPYLSQHTSHDSHLFWSPFRAAGLSFENDSPSLFSSGERRPALNRLYKIGHSLRGFTKLECPETVAVLISSTRWVDPQGGIKMNLCICLRSVKNVFAR